MLVLDSTCISYINVKIYMCAGECVDELLVGNAVSSDTVSGIFLGL